MTIENDTIEIILPYKVLGRTEDDKVILYFPVDKRIRVLSIPKFTQNFFELNFDDADENWKNYKKETLKVARNKPLIDLGSSYGNGIWKPNDRDWLIVSGSDTFTIDANGTVTRLEDPVYNSKIIDISGPSWLSYESFCKAWNDKTNDIKRAFKAVFSRIQRWGWLNPQMPLFASAFAMLTPFQRILDWRPTIFIYGEKGTGKSSFFDSNFVTFYGKLICDYDETTAAAFENILNNSSQILLLDEIQQFVELEKITLKMKSLGRGGKRATARGTSVSDSEKKHLIWFAGTDLPALYIKDPAFRSRIVQFNTVLKINKALPELPDAYEQEGMAALIVVNMIKKWNDIAVGASSLRKNISAISDKYGKTISPRLIDNYKYASALLNLIDPKADIDIPFWVTDEETDNFRVLIRAILTSTAKSKLIISLLHEANSGVESAKNQIKNLGMSITTHKKKSYLAIGFKDLPNTLLKKYDFTSKEIKRILLSVDGAVENRVKFGYGRMVSCVLIPWEIVESFD